MRRVLSPDLNFEDIARSQLSRDLPGVCILALSVDDEQATQVVNCARLGCHGIVPRNTSIEGVVRIVRG